MNEIPRALAASAIRVILGLLVAVLVSLGASTPARSAPAAPDDDAAARVIPESLAPVFRDWLDAVDPLITDEEWQQFIALAEDYQRKAFIESFWRQRDPYPDTARNEARERHDERILFARQRFERLRGDVRAHFLVVNGIPDRWATLDCLGITRQPIEVWIYDLSLRESLPFPVVFLKRWRGRRPWTRWEPFTDGGLTGLLKVGVSDTHAVVCPGLELLWESLRLIRNFNERRGAQDSYVFSMEKLAEPEPPPSTEWVSTFASYTTEPPADALPFDAEVALTFPGWRQSRTVVQAVIDVDTRTLPPSELAGYRAWNLTVNGEVLRRGELLDQFRYRFDVPASDVSNDRLPLVLQRYLRPGDYKLILLVQDTDGRHAARRILEFTVPAVDRAAVPLDLDPEVVRLLGDANRLIEGGEAEVEIVMPHGDLTTGLVRFDARVFGDAVDHVVFHLDNKRLMSRRHPPYSVELDFGTFPTTKILRVSAHNEDGDQLASDERVVNGIPYRFDVRLIDPLPGVSYRGSVRARADVRVPEGAHLERLELYRGDDRLATLYEPPFVQPIRLASSQEMVIVRAVAYLRDGTSAEDVVLVNGPAAFEEVGVDFVELYTSVLDKRRRPVRGLGQTAFRVLEDGREQQVSRFDPLAESPISVLVMLDTSASMAPRLERARGAAMQFFERAISDAREDRIGVIAFNDRPSVVSPYTREPERFAAGIATAKAERGTALYDSLIYAQFYAGGLSGPRAILVLSDGVDESSRFSFEQTLDFARRSEITIYAVGLGLEALDKDDAKQARRALERLTDATGGAAFFIQEIESLTLIYQQVLDELRARYLLAYQSDNDGDSDAFRRIEVKVQGGHEAKTLRGYYP